MESLWETFIAFPDRWVVGILVIVVFLYWLFNPADRRRSELFFIWTLIIIPATFAAFLVLRGLSSLFTSRYDLYVYRFDEVIGEPSFRLSQIALAHHWFYSLIRIVYGSFALAWLGVLGANLWLRSVRHAIHVAKTLILNVFVSFGLYIIFPVSGPLYAFPTYPRLPQSFSAHVIYLTAIPNGVPSVHFSSALLVLWFQRRWKVGLWMGITFACLTVVATLATGEHYAFDLLWSFPYTALILWLMRPDATAADSGSAAE